MSMTTVAIVIIALWLLLGVLGVVLHLLKGLLILAAIATVLVLVFGRPRKVS